MGYDKFGLNWNVTARGGASAKKQGSPWHDINRSRMGCILCGKEFSGKEVIADGQPFCNNLCGPPASLPGFQAKRVVAKETVKPRDKEYDFRLHCSHRTRILVLVYPDLLQRYAPHGRHFLFKLALIFLWNRIGGSIVILIGAAMLVSVNKPRFFKAVRTRSAS